MFKKIVFGTKLFDIALSIFNFLMLLSLRICWSGISKKLGYEDNPTWLLYNLPVILTVVALLVMATNITLFFVLKKDSKIWAFIMVGVNIVFLVLNIVVIALGAIDYMHFIWPWFFVYLEIFAVIALILFFIFIYPHTSLKDSKACKISLLSLTLLTASVGIFDVSFNKIETKPVVYAVEDKYQIAFTSHTNARGWVEIDGVRYFDTYAGSNESYTKYHKVEVPMSVLDEAKAYTIHTQKITYRGPFGGYLGRDIHESYNFKPVDSTDGINYYVISDVHEAKKASIKATSYTNNEFIVLAGDICSMVEWERDLLFTNEVAHEMTKGEIPVVYARGNHELKGKKAEELHKVVGAKGEYFYYSFTLGKDIYGVVLDLGEDHEDDYWEYYDTAFYDGYRQAQVDFLKEELLKGEYLNYSYRMAICHIPIPFVNTRHNHVTWKEQMTDLLNKMNIDISLSGHQHDLLIFEPGTLTPGEKLTYTSEYNGKEKTIKAYVTDFTFPTLLVSKRGYAQTDSIPLKNMKSQIGVSVSVDLTNNTQTFIYNDSNGKHINMVNPFVEINYGNKIVFPLNSN